jgi:hypothetical protein
MDQEPALRARWRRDLHSFVAMVIAGIAVTTLAGVLIPTRFTWIASPEELDHAIFLMLVPGIAGMIAMGIAWYWYPYLAWGHERWPFGPREKGGNGRRLSDVLLPNLLGFAVARLVPAPFAIVSSIYMDPVTGNALRVDAPVDVASRFVVFLAAYTLTWVATFAVVTWARAAWARRHVAAPAPVTDAA